MWFGIPNCVSQHKKISKVYIVEKMIGFIFRYLFWLVAILLYWECVFSRFYLNAHDKFWKKSNFSIAWTYFEQFYKDEDCYMSIRIGILNTIRLLWSSEEYVRKKNYEIRESEHFSFLGVYVNIDIEVFTISFQLDFIWFYLVWWITERK